MIFLKNIQNEDTLKYSNKSKKNKFWLSLMVGFIISFFIVLMVFLSILMYMFVKYYMEYKDYELANKGEYVYHETDRELINNYENIYNKENIFNMVNLEESEKKEIKSKMIVTNKEKNFDINNEFIHGSYSYVTSTGIEPQKIKIEKKYKQPTICVQDWFNDGHYHGETIYSYIKTLYDGPVYLIDNNTFNYQLTTTHEFYKECDIVNMSMRFFFESKPGFVNNIVKNIYRNDTLFIYASGNDLSDSSETEQKLTKNKINLMNLEDERYPDLKDKISTNFIGVTQGVIDIDNNKARNVFSGGEGIDFVVFNADLYRDSEKILGTSFAAPFVTAMAANLAQAGVPNNEIKNYLYSDYILNEDGYDYGIVLSDDIQNKINKLHNN